MPANKSSTASRSVARKAPLSGKKRSFLEGVKVSIISEKNRFWLGLISGIVLVAIVVIALQGQDNYARRYALTPTQAGAANALRQSNNDITQAAVEVEKATTAKKCILATVQRVFLRRNCAYKNQDEIVKAADSKLAGKIEKRQEIFQANANNPEQFLEIYTKDPNISLNSQVSSFIESRRYQVSTPDKPAEVVGKVSIDAKVVNNSTSYKLRTGNTDYTLYTNGQVSATMPKDTDVIVKGSVVSSNFIKLRDSNLNTFVQSSFQAAPGQTLNASSGSQVITVVPVNTSKQSVAGNANTAVSFLNAQAAGAKTFSLVVADPISLPGGDCDVGTARSLSGGSYAGIVIYVFEDDGQGNLGYTFQNQAGVACNGGLYIAHEILHNLGLSHNDCGVGDGTLGGNIMAHKSLVNWTSSSPIPPLTQGQKHILRWVNDPASCSTTGSGPGGANPASGPSSAPVNSFIMGSTNYGPYASNPNRNSIINNSYLVCPISMSAQRGSIIQVPVSSVGNFKPYITVKTRARPGDAANQVSSRGIAGSSDPARAGVNGGGNLEVEVRPEVAGSFATLIIEGYLQAYTGDKTPTGDPKDQFPIYLGCAVDIQITGTHAPSSGASISVAGHNQDFAIGAGQEVSVTWYIPRSMANCVVYAGTTAIAQNVYEMNDSSAYKVPITQPTQFSIKCTTLQSVTERVTVASVMVSLGNQPEPEVPNVGNVTCSPDPIQVTMPMSSNRDFTLTMSFPQDIPTGSTIVAIPTRSEDNFPYLTTKAVNQTGARFFTLSMNMRVSAGGVHYTPTNGLTVTAKNSAGTVIGQCILSAYHLNTGNNVDYGYGGGPGHSIVINTPYTTENLTVKVGETKTFTNVIVNDPTTAPVRLWTLADDYLKNQYVGYSTHDSEQYKEYASISMSGTSFTVTGIKAGVTTAYIRDSRPIPATAPIGITVLDAAVSSGGGTGGGSGSGGTGAPGCQGTSSDQGLTLSCSGANVTTEDKVQSITIKLNGTVIAQCFREETADKHSLSCPFTIPVGTTTGTLVAKADIRGGLFGSTDYQTSLSW